jgi:hypothetical protein
LKKKLLKEGWLLLFKMELNTLNSNNNYLLIELNKMVSSMMGLLLIALMLKSIMQLLLPFLQTNFIRIFINVLNQ